MNCGASRTLDVEGRRIHCLEWGDPLAPTVILLHAQACHSHWWDWVATRLAADFHLIAPDFRGHGESDPGPLYSFQEYVNDTLIVIESLRVGSYHLIGHSMGGYVGLMIAATNPAGLLSLVVADMICRDDEEDRKRSQEASTRPARTYLTRNEAMANYRLTPPVHVVPEHVLHHLAETSFMQLPEGTWGMRLDRKVLCRDPIMAFDIAPAIQCPVLIVRGEYSQLMQREDAQQLTRKISNAHFAELPRTYHHLVLENPNGFVDIVRTFYSSLS